MTASERIKAFLTERASQENPTKPTRAREDGLTPEQITEAHRIAGKLVKLHKRGIIKDATDPDARFYATMIHQFGGTVVVGDKTETAPDTAPVKLTNEQRVRVPHGLRGKALDDFLQRDLEATFGDGDDL